MPKMLSAPVVYVGSSLTHDEVQRAFPGCIMRPPIARGDLYRDRLLHGSVFLILDGVFHQQRAVSPREISDVIADGALVIGAASMGALRAAECWPAGMLGVGAVYRLFRSGVLTSDDEVAVSFDPERPGLNVSVALVNVRYALWRGVQSRRIDRVYAARLFAAAQSLFYPDRNWPLIAKHAGVGPGGALAADLAAYDLKRLDALRALRRVKRWSAGAGQFFERPSAASGFMASHERERAHDPLHGAGGPVDLYDFVRWLLASGRYARYPVAPALRSGRSAFPEGVPASKELGRWLAQQGVFDPEAWLAQRTLDAKVLARTARARRWFDKFRLREEECVQLILAAVTVAGELDAELFRYHAQRRLVARAKEIGLSASELDCHEAEQCIALEHDCDNWSELLSGALGGLLPPELLVAHREQLALAQAMQRRMSVVSPGC
jgi:hypothetical protein